MDNGFVIGSKKFKVGKLSAFKQFHIVRRLAPLLSEMAPVLKKISSMGQEELQQDQFALLEPVLKGIGELSDKDADFVLLGLLSCVEIYQDQFNTWARVVNGDMLMIPDLDLPTMLQAAGRAFAFNMAGFFSESPQGSPAAG